MDTSYFQDWFQRRIEIADNIFKIFGKDGVSDAEIIIFCAASALSYISWPRTDKQDHRDRKRFVEFLVKFSSGKYPIKIISTALLIQQLDQPNHKTDADILIEKFFRSKYDYYSKSPERYHPDIEDIRYAPGTLSRIIDPKDIDATEERILELIPAIKLKEIRKSSYASIIYSDLRSGLVHKYEPGEKVARRGWNRKDDKLSYINYMIMPDEKDVEEFASLYNIDNQEARDALAQTQRRIYFPYEFIRNTVSDAANSLFEHWRDASTLSQNEPTKWWIDG